MSWHLTTMLDVLRYFSIGLPIILLLRLIHQKLWLVSPYSGLAFFLATGIARDLIMLVPGYSTHSFTVMWEATLPVLLVAQVMAGVATFKAIGQLYPRIGSFAVILFAACIIVALLAGAALLPFEIRRIGSSEAELRVLFLAQRWVATLLAGGLAIVVVFLSRYPAPLKRLPRNIRIHTVCIAIYFGSYATLYTLENIKALGGASWAELGQLALVVLVYAGWTAGLSQSGQTSEAWPKIDPAVGEMINAQYETARSLIRQAAGEGARR